MDSWVLIAVSVLLIVIVVVLYNRMVSLRNHRENAFADIDVQLKQRHDLIPQLIGAVKGYTKHEEGVLTKVTEARQNAMAASGVNEKINAERELSASLRTLSIQVEAYPDLKASSNFMQLQEEIADIENKLSAARRFFNSTTREFNTAVQKFPANLLAGIFGFGKEPMFDLGSDARAEAQKAPEVSF